MQVKEKLSASHIHRLSALCSKSAEGNLPLLVDAEDTSVRPAVDYLTYEAAVRFNRGSDRIVYGKIQAYLKDSKDRLTEAAHRAGIPMGFKLVRSAYMTRDVRLASSLGAASPIHSSIHGTHACYNQGARFLLESAARGSCSVVLATHNKESVAAAKVEELGMGKWNPNVQFAQLKGKAEGLSLGLRNVGFNISKCLPFGPVDKGRILSQAEENGRLLSASSSHKTAHTRDRHGSVRKKALSS